jgi:acyl-CoA thioester hydrolase
MTSNNFDPRDANNYDHWVDDNIRFCDQDAAGHVNNTAISQYVESGRVAYCRDKLWSRTEGARFVAARVAIDYLKEAHYPGKVRTGTRIARIGTKSTTTIHGVFVDDVCIASAECVLVHLIGMETTALSDDMRAKLEADLI